MLKVKVHLTDKQYALIDHTEIRHTLNKAFFAKPVEWDQETQVSTRMKDITEHLDEGEALLKIVEQRELSAADKKILLAKGKGIIAQNET